MSSILVNNLNSLFDEGKLYNSWMINTSDCKEVLSNIRGFVNDRLFGIASTSNHPDCLIVKSDNSQINIDQIRDVQYFLSHTSVTSDYRVVIIIDADKMNLHAANASLKFLEDTPKRSYIFLITSNLNRILPTVRSRCYVVNSAIQGLSSNSNFAELTQLFMPNCPPSFKLSTLQNLASKNKDLWYEISQIALSLMSDLVKYVSGVQSVDVPKVLVDQLRSLSVEVLLDRFEYITKLIQQTDMYELDIRASTILLIGQFDVALPIK